jgi:HAD superfamily hydrolase (TIGR02253 family)
MKKKAVLFDLDNTLYEYEPVHKKALKAAYNILKKEIEISFERFEKLYKISVAEIHRELAGSASSHNKVLYFQRFVEKTHKTVEPDLILKLYSTYWNAFLKNMRMKKDVLETLKKIKAKGFKTALISDLTTHIQLRKMNKLKITPYIDFLVTSEEAGAEKPHPIMFLLALNKLRVSPEESIMVGDNPINDIEGANAVGIDSVLLGRGKIEKEKEDYQNPKFVIKEIPELLKILEI